MNLTMDKEYKEVLSGGLEVPNRCNCINCFYDIEKRFSNVDNNESNNDIIEFRTVLSGKVGNKFHLNKN